MVIISSVAQLELSESLCSIALPAITPIHNAFRAIIPLMITNSAVCAIASPEQWRQRRKREPQKSLPFHSLGAWVVFVNLNGDRMQYNETAQ